MVDIACPQCGHFPSQEKDKQARRGRISYRAKCKMCGKTWVYKTEEGGLSLEPDLSPKVIKHYGPFTITFTENELRRLDEVKTENALQRLLEGKQKGSHTQDWWGRPKAGLARHNFPAPL
jgi:transposase-like protein